MRTVEYKCNICRDIKEITHLRGIWFVSSMSKPSLFEQKPPRDTENHICIDCIKQIKEKF